MKVRPRVLQAALVGWLICSPLVSQARDCWWWNRSYRSERRTPVTTYERYSPAGYPYEYSRVEYYPPGVAYRCESSRPVPRYRYERYSPGGYPYEWSRVDYYPNR